MIEILTSFIVAARQPYVTSQKQGTTAYLMTSKDKCIALGSQLEAFELKWKAVPEGGGFCYITRFKF